MKIQYEIGDCKRYINVLILQHEKWKIHANLTLHDDKYVSDHYEVSEKDSIVTNGFTSLQKAIDYISKN